MFELPSVENCKSRLCPSPLASEIAHKQQYRGFQKAHGPGYTGLVPTTWVPMGA